MVGMPVKVCIGQLKVSVYHVHAHACVHVYLTVVYGMYIIYCSLCIHQY